MRAIKAERKKLLREKIEELKAGRTIGITDRQLDGLAKASEKDFKTIMAMEVTPENTAKTANLLTCMNKRIDY